MPVLWLFTDAARAPDPLPAVAALPRGLCGVVLRHDGVPGRAALGRAVARLCRARGHALAVAGDARLARALGAGVHLRGGRWPGPVRVPGGGPRVRFGRVGGWITASAHDPAELRRAARAGADAVFLSPAFATASHAGAGALGPARWAAWARGVRGPSPGAASRGSAPRVLALGGVDGRRAGRLPRRVCAGAGAIGALLP